MPLLCAFYNGGSITLQFTVDKLSVYCSLGLGQRKQTKPPLATVVNEPIEEYVFRKENCEATIILICTE